MFLNFISESSNFIISFHYGNRSFFQLLSPFWKLFFQFINLCLHFLSLRLGVAVQVCTLVFEKPFEIINLLLKLRLHIIKFWSFSLFELLKSSFIIFDHSTFLIFKKPIHISPLIFMILLHLSFCGFMILCHLLYFCLELVHHVTWILFKHIDLLLEFGDLFFVIHFSFFSFVDFQLFFIFNLLNSILKFSNLLLQFFYLII